MRFSHLGGTRRGRAGQKDELAEDPVAMLQAVYDKVLRIVLRSGRSRPAWEVNEILARRLRDAFGSNQPEILVGRAWTRDGEELAAGRRVVVTDEFNDSSQ